MRRREHERIVHVLRVENRDLRDENRELRDRIMYLMGKPWTPAPSEVVVPVEEPEQPETFIDVDELLEVSE